MSPSGPLLCGLTTLLALGAACAPSSNAGRAPRAGADSAPEATQEVPSQTAPVAPERTADPTADVCVPPPPPAAAKPVYLPHPAGPYRFANGGRAYVMGTVGSRYSVVIANPTAQRVEVVLSVDGLDAMDGHPANYVEKRGYILPAYGDVTIDGFRTSFDDVATFRFSSVADSYAGRLGQARDVGVIGVAFFPEQPPVRVWQPLPPPMREPPRSAAPPPRPRAPVDDLADDSSGTAAGGAAMPSAPAPAPPSGVVHASEAPTKRPGLGTEFGEARASRVETVAFTRANPSRPSQLVSIRYNDRAGLTALGIVIPPPYVAAETDQGLRESADPFRANRFAQPPP